MLILLPFLIWSNYRAPPFYPPEPFPLDGGAGWGAQHYLWTTGSISIDDGPDMLSPYGTNDLPGLPSVDDLKLL
jgi:hypothetical protein